MNISFDGRPLSKRHALALLTVLAPEIAQEMAAQGFSLCPMHAPRMRHGGVVARFAWQKRDGGVKIVLRGTVTLQRPASV